MNEQLWIDGEFMPLGDGRVSIEDRALLFGDGIYEVIAAYDGVPILLDEHMDRWEKSAAGLRIEPRYNRDTRIGVIQELLRRFRAPRVSIYGQLTRGSGKRAHVFPGSPRPMEFWYVRDMPNYAPALYTEGAAVVTHPDERWTRCWIKSTCLLANCLAKQYAQEHGAFESVLFQEDGTVTEGAVANFHVVKNGVIRTHPANGRILSGCKREMVFSLARANGIAINEEKYDLEYLRNADEAFLTSTTINVIPVTKCDGKPIGDGKVGAVTKRLMGFVDEAIREVRRGAFAVSR